ncbi:cytochrome b [Jeongeupia sp. USM3]|uniref:cytochrome b n=1 Tax=Jeongeupia sp. USM3 TaxID=1906741 RepID=UPI00089DF5C3|nr:cytochrome b [Jeongeupia sp. USM3]AOY00014.1 cytochrome b [Jeongeupia sp. USM3]
MSRDRYDPLQMSLHWLMALLIFSAFGLIWYFNSLELGPQTFKLKFQVIAWHKWAGISVMFLLILRLAWRLGRGAPAPLPGQPAWQLKAAAGIHHLLYLLMFALPCIGWLMSSAKGYPVVLFGEWPLPDLVGKNAELGETLAEIHYYLGYTLLALVVLHAAAAIKHHLIDRDATLSRMLPWGR